MRHYHGAIYTIERQTNAGLAEHARNIFAEHGVIIEMDQDVVNDKMMIVQPEHVQTTKLAGQGYYSGRLESARSSGGVAMAV